jgi:hypothetical protein
MCSAMMRGDTRNVAATSFNVNSSIGADIYAPRLSAPPLPLLEQWRGRRLLADRRVTDFAIGETVFTISNSLFSFHFGHMRCVLFYNAIALGNGRNIGLRGLFAMAVKV